MVYYEPVKVTINALGLAKVSLDVVVRHHSLSDTIVTDQGLRFISKFGLLLCYFFRIKRRLSTVFYSQTHGQTKTKKSMMEA